MYCKTCGSYCADGLKQCPRCGAALSAPVNPTPTATPAPVRSGQPAPDAGSILTFGILGLAFACSFFISFLGIVFSCIAKGKYNAYIAAGGVPTGKASTGKNLAKAGLIVGIILTAIFGVYFTIVVIAAAAL